jgi:hypothetical protein
MTDRYEDMPLKPGEPVPDEFFAARGWSLECFEEDGDVFADLVPSGRSARRVLRYGCGRDEERAALAAMRRWQVEQAT